MSAYGEEDAPASSTEPETTDAKSMIALLKGIKNQNIDLLASLADPASQTTLASMAADIALMKSDLAAIRAILES